MNHNINGLVKDCSNSSALAVKLLQSCAKPWNLNFVLEYIYVIFSPSRWKDDVRLSVIVTKIAQHGRWRGQRLQ